MNEMDLIRPKDSLLAREVSFNYFQDGTRSFSRSLSRIDLANTSFGALKLHAQTYVYALALEADARFAISAGSEKTNWGNEVVRWQKVIFSSRLENWNPFLEEVNVELIKLRAKPNLTQEESDLLKTLLILYSRISKGK